MSTKHPEYLQHTFKKKSIKATKEINKNMKLINSIFVMNTKNNSHVRRFKKDN